MDGPTLTMIWVWPGLAWPGLAQARAQRAGRQGRQGRRSAGRVVVEVVGGRECVGCVGERMQDDASGHLSQLSSARRRHWAVSTADMQDGNPSARASRAWMMDGGVGEMCV